MRPFLPIVFVVAGASLGLACDRAPTAEGLKEWTVADHDGEKRGPVGNQGGRVTGGDAGGIPMLVDVTWKNQCQSCHGPTGRGDGPQGPMFKAADLGREEWQSKVKDDEIASTIVTGKGRMPKFELPEEIVKGLVVRVRSFRGR
jgi:cytochrome c oxidase cbb3-type subunit 3